jgi:hypothetical protein
MLKEDEQDITFSKRGVASREFCPAKTAAHPATASSDNFNSSVAGSSIAVFDELVTCMGRVALPPVFDSHMSASMASQVAIMRENFTNAHGCVLVCIQNMQSVWSVLNTLSTSVDSPPAASHTDALKAQIRDLELQLAETSLAVHKTASDLKSCDTVSRDLARFQKLSDAVNWSLRRKNKEFMGEVYNRRIEQLEPIGLKAKALVTALHAINPSLFPADASDCDAAKKLKELDSGNKGHCDFEELCTACNVSSSGGTEISHARDVFLRFANVKGLTASALMDALKEVDAPVLLSGEGCSPEQIFRRADTDINGLVDLPELDPPPPPFPHCLIDHYLVFRFMRAAALPDELEMILEDDRLSVSAALFSYYM